MCAVPIANTGFCLTGLAGEVQLRPQLRIEVSGTIESMVAVPGVGPLISGEPTLWVGFGDPAEIGISGRLNVLTYEAAEAALVLSQSEGLKGSVSLSLGAIHGGASLHVWRGGDDEYHGVVYSQGSGAHDCVSILERYAESSVHTTIRGCDLAERDCRCSAHIWAAVTQCAD